MISERFSYRNISPKGRIKFILSVEQKIVRNITVNPYYAQIFNNLTKSWTFIDLYRYFDGFRNCFFSCKRRTELKIWQRFPDFLFCAWGRPHGEKTSKKLREDSKKLREFFSHFFGRRWYFTPVCDSRETKVPWVRYRGAYDIGVHIAYHLGTKYLVISQDRKVL